MSGNSHGITRSYDSAAAGGGGAAIPTFLSDNGLVVNQTADEVQIDLPPGVTDGHVMTFDSGTGDWEARVLPSPATVSSSTGLIVTQNSSAITVNLPAGSITGDLLTWDNAATDWVRSAAPAAGIDTLDELTDVILTSPANNDVLKYNGSEWVNSPGLNVLTMGRYWQASLDNIDMKTVANHLFGTPPAGYVFKCTNIYNHMASVTAHSSSALISIGTVASGYQNIRSNTTSSQPSVDNTTSGPGPSGNTGVSDAIYLSISAGATATTERMDWMITGVLFPV